MNRRRALVAVSAAQLAAGVTGQLIAVRDRRPFDIALLRWRGKPENVREDSLFLGTGLSAPMTMLVTQAVATMRLAASPSQLATRTLGTLGAAMTCGYLIEREFRGALSLSPAGFDPTVTSVAAVGFALAVAMAAMALPSPARTR